MAGHILWQVAYAGLEGCSADQLKGFIAEAYGQERPSPGVFWYFWQTVMIPFLSNDLGYYDQETWIPIAELSPKNSDFDAWLRSQTPRLRFALRRSLWMDLILGSDKATSSLSPICISILSAIVQSKNAGMTAVALANQVGLDAKTFFHHCKRLVLMQLVYRREKFFVYHSWTLA